MPKAKSDRDRLIDYSYRATNQQLEEAIQLFRAALSARNAAKGKPATAKPAAVKSSTGDQSKVKGE